MIHFDTYTIRPLEVTDLAKYFDLVQRNRKRLEDFFTGTTSRTKDITATEEFLQELVAKRATKKYYPFVVVDTTTQQLIAFIDLKNVDWKIPKTEIGCYTDEGYAGTGLTTKAVQLFLAYCFDHFEFKKIFLRTHQSNKAAIRLAENCGFEVEGIIRLDYRTTSGELIDLIYYGLLRD